MISFPRPREPDLSAAHASHELQLDAARGLPVRLDERDPLGAAEAVALDADRLTEILPRAAHDAQARHVDGTAPDVMLTR